MGKKTANQTFKTDLETKARLKVIAKKMDRKSSWLCDHYVNAGLDRDEAKLKRKEKLI